MATGRPLVAEPTKTDTTFPPTGARVVLRSGEGTCVDGRILSREGRRLVVAAPLPAGAGFVGVEWRAGGRQYILEGGATRSQTAGAMDVFARNASASDRRRDPVSRSVTGCSWRRS
jgi:hypothetical protein